MSRGDHTAYQGFVQRVIVASGKRVGRSDPEDLTELLALRAVLDEAIAAAVAEQRRQGFSWSAIARAAGITKQSAQERWGVRPSLTDADGRGPVA